jgi:prophage regulatory protein
VGLPPACGHLLRNHGRNDKEKPPAELAERLPRPKPVLLPERVEAYGAGPSRSIQIRDWPPSLSSTSEGIELPMASHNEHTRAIGSIAPRTQLPETGFVRLSSIIGPGGPIPVSRSTWWAGVAAGRYPRPVKLAPPITAWRVEDIRALIERGGRS